MPHEGRIEGVSQFVPSTSGMWRAFDQLPFGPITGPLPSRIRLCVVRAVLTPVLWKTLQFIQDRPGCSHLDLAQAFEVSGPAVSRRMDRLVASRLVSRQRTRRGYLSTITRKGTHALQQSVPQPADQVVDALRRRPGLGLRQLARAIGSSLTATRWHVQRLVAAGLIANDSPGKRHRYRTTANARPSQESTASSSLRQRTSHN